MQLTPVALILAVLQTAYAAAVVSCPLGCHGCDGSETIIWKCVDQGNGIRAMKTVQVCREDGACRIGQGCSAWCDYSHQDLPSALVATEANCQLGANKCDDSNNAVIICGVQGWKATETCSKPGACHVGSTGDAYCDEEVNCTPGKSQCDAANYASKFCNSKGLWKTDRKCSKPGCCEIRGGKALCKTDCGAGQQPPTKRSAVKTSRDLPKSENHWTAIGKC